MFGPESVASDLVQQVRCRDRVSCPRYRSNRTIRDDRYMHFEWYRNCRRSVRLMNFYTVGPDISAPIELFLQLTPNPATELADRTLT